jgi:hypothetical protein
VRTLRIAEELEQRKTRSAPVSPSISRPGNSAPPANSPRKALIA